VSPELPEPPGQPADRAVLVTGISGAGRTTCLKIFEDLGFEAVDNLPAALLERVLRGDESGPHAIAVGIDSRSRGIEPKALAAGWRRWTGEQGLQASLLYLDCDDDVLRRRFSETRRRHPFGDFADVHEAIRHERAFLAPLEQAADLVIDTSELAIPELRRLLVGHFAGPSSRCLLSVVSFSYKRGVPREADLVLDVRFLRNPHYDETLRPQTGLDPMVREYVRADPDFAGFMDNLRRLLTPLLPRYGSEGKSYLTIAVGCTGGRHRSVYVADRLGEWLSGNGWDATVRHRDLPATATAPLEPVFAEPGGERQ